MTEHSCVIGDAIYDDSIVKVWKGHYEKLISQHDNIANETAEYALHYDYSNCGRCIRCSAIDNLKSGKSYGPDGIAAEAMKYGGELLAVHLTLLFNIIVSHCYIPQDLIITTIVPLGLLKNKTGDASDVNNYRAIALSNSLSKLLESVVLNCFQTKSFKLCRLDELFE